MFLSISQDGESWKSAPLDQFVKTLVLQHIIDHGIVKSDLRRGARDSFQDWKREDWDPSNWEQKIYDVERQLDRVEIIETLLPIGDDGEESTTVLQAQHLQTFGCEMVTMMVEGSLSETIADIVREMIR